MTDVARKDILARIIEKHRAERQRSKTQLVQARIPIDLHRQALEILNRHGFGWNELIQEAVLDLLAEAKENPELAKEPRDEPEDASGTADDQEQGN